MKKVSIYERRGELWVAPVDGMVVAAPVFPSNLTVSELSRALESGLAAAPEHPTPWIDLRDYKSPVRLAAKVRSDKELERDLRNSDLECTDDGYVLSRWLPNRKMDRGFVPDPEWTMKLPATTPMVVVAEKLIDALCNTEWPTR